MQSSLDVCGILSDLDAVIFLDEIEHRLVPLVDPCNK